MRSAKIEDALRELIELAKKKPLKGSDKKRAEQLTRYLRENGFTNEDIEKSTGGALSEPTIKVYSRGARVLDPTPKEEILSLLSEILQTGRSLEEVDDFVSFSKRIDAAGLTHDHFLSFLAEAKRQGFRTEEFAKLLKQLKGAGLTPDEAKMALSTSSEMQQLGVTAEMLSKIVGVTKKLGKPEQTFQVVTSYADMKAIQSDLDRLNSEKSKSESELKGLSAKVEKAGKDVEDLKMKEAGMRSNLELYERFKKSGFTEEVLGEIGNLSRRYGGPRNVISAIGQYAGIEELRAKKQAMESALKKVEADHAHLQPVIKVCDELIYELGFSPESITKLYDVAKKYGKPHEVMDALGTFKDLTEMKSQTEEIEEEKSELDARKRELEKEVKTLTARRDELYGSVAKSVSSIDESYKKSIASISSTHEEHLKRWRQLEAEAGKLEEELRLAKVFNAIFKYPLETKEIPLEIVLRLIQAVKSVCAIKGVDPKVQAGDEIRSRSPTINQYTTVPLLDILDWAYRGLLGEILKQKS